MLAALLLSERPGGVGKKPGKNLPTWHVFKTDQDKREDAKLDAFIDEQEAITKSAEVFVPFPSVDAAQAEVSPAPKVAATPQPVAAFPTQDDLRALQRLHALEARQMIIDMQAAYSAQLLDDEETLIAILLAID